MDRPNATQNISTGSEVSMNPVAVKPSRADRWPSWNTQTTAPNIAASDSAFTSTVLTGSSTLPVIRYITNSVTATITPSAQGSRPVIAAWLSASSADAPSTSAV